MCWRIWRPVSHGQLGGVWQAKAVLVCHSWQRSLRMVIYLWHSRSASGCWLVVLVNAWLPVLVFDYCCGFGMGCCWPEAPAERWGQESCSLDLLTSRSHQRGHVCSEHLSSVRVLSFTGKDFRSGRSDIFFFSLQVPVKSLQDRLYVRISAHIYNNMSDYEKLADAVNTVSQRNEKKML